MKWQSRKYTFLNIWFENEYLWNLKVVDSCNRLLKIEEIFNTILFTCILGEQEKQIGKEKKIKNITFV